MNSIILSLALSCATAADCPPCQSPSVPTCDVSSDPNSLHCGCGEQARGCSASGGEAGGWLSAPAALSVLLLRRQRGVRPPRQARVL